MHLQKRISEINKVILDPITITFVTDIIGKTLFGKLVDHIDIFSIIFRDSLRKAVLRNSKRILENTEPFMRWRVRAFLEYLEIIDNMISRDKDKIIKIIEEWRKGEIGEEKLRELLLRYLRLPVIDKRISREKLIEIFLSEHQEERKVEEEHGRLLDMLGDLVEYVFKGYNRAYIGLRLGFEHAILKISPVDEEHQLIIKDYNGRIKGTFSLRKERILEDIHKHVTLMTVIKERVRDVEFEKVDIYVSNELSSLEVIGEGYNISVYSGEHIGKNIYIDIRVKKPFVDFDLFLKKRLKGKVGIKDIYGVRNIRIHASPRLGNMLEYLDYGLGVKDIVRRLVDEYSRLLSMGLQRKIGEEEYLAIYLSAVSDMKGVELRIKRPLISIYGIVARILRKYASREYFKFKKELLHETKTVRRHPLKYKWKDIIIILIKTGYIAFGRDGRIYVNGKPVDKILSSLGLTEWVEKVERTIYWLIVEETFGRPQELIREDILLSPTIMSKIIKYNNRYLYPLFEYIVEKDPSLWFKLSKDTRESLIKVVTWTGYISSIISKALEKNNAEIIVRDVLRNLGSETVASLLDTVVRENLALAVKLIFEYLPELIGNIAVSVEENGFRVKGTNILVKPKYIFNTVIRKSVDNIYEVLFLKHGKSMEVKAMTVEEAYKKALTVENVDARI